MSITSSSVNIDGTCSVTGGTATGVKSKGQDLDEHKVVLDDGSEFLAQSTVLFSISDPKVSASAPNGYTQARSTVRIHKPLALDNGKYTMNTLQISLSCDHETTAAEIDSLRSWAAQLLFDSDYDQFWQQQILS